MCGIAALFSSEPASLGELVRRMATAARHRGPDGEGVVTFSARDFAATALGGADTSPAVFDANLAYAPQRNAESVNDAVVALGHRRLSIIDVSATGHQPMCTSDRRFWIVFNGEIYNHVELRAELEGLGYVFASHSDTEVILNAYKEWGERCLDRFNGMFAFVLVDRTTRRIFAARDRFGVKPLYLWRSPQGVVAMASEIKQFSTLPGWSAKANGQRAYEFLNWGWLDHTEETLFDGVRQLRGGECIHCSLDELLISLPIRRWYTLAPRAFHGDMQAATDEFRSLFTDAVRLRLRADVPVGSCLSGGIDSSSIVCVANQLLRATSATCRQNTFSACSNVERYDERNYIDIVVENTGVRGHYVYPVLDELFDTLDDMTWHQDEPFGSTSIYAQWHVFKLAADARVRVLLDGQGADELLAGYYTFFAPHLAGLLVSGRWGALMQEMRAAKRLHGIGFLGASEYLANALLPDTLRQPLRRLAGKSSSAPNWFDKDRFASDDRDQALMGHYQTTSVNQMAESLLIDTSVPKLLHWADRSSMAHSIESRLPFLDFRLVEFSMGLPPETKLWNGTTKQVLREAMRGTLPEPIRMRMDKMGFVTPEETWMRLDAPQRFRAELVRAIDASQGMLMPAALEHFDAVLAGKQPFDFRVWRMISFGAWLRRFDVRVQG